MKNIYKETFNEIFESRDTGLTVSGKFILSEYILKNGNALYVPENFNLDAFSTAVKLHLFNELNQVTDSVKIDEHILQISYASEDSIADKLNISEKYKILLYYRKNVLYVNIDIAEATDNPDEKKSMLNLSSLLNDSYKKEMFIFMYEYIYNSYIKKFSEKKLNFGNKYIDDTHLNERICIHTICEDETILAKLNISSIKNDRIDLSNTHNASFLLTDKNAALLCFNKSGELLFFQPLSDDFTIIKRLGKNALKYNGTTWYPMRSNASLYADLQGVFTYFGNERIKELSRLNYLQEEYQTAEDLLMLYKDSENDPTDNLCMLFIKSKANENTEDDYFSNENLEKHTDEILKIEDAELKILEAFELWNIDYNKKTLFLNLFSKLADTAEEKEKILPLYESVREEFIKKNKEKINHSVFDINYADFLISAGHNRKAIKLLNRLADNLPDEITSDLLPVKTVNLAGDKSGQLLRITIIDLLAKAKGKESAGNQTQKSVQLQPLNKGRLLSLSSVRDNTLKEKAADILNILSEKGLEGELEQVELQDLNPLNEKQLNLLRHPATLKKGSFYSIQKWTSKVKTEDYAALKNYSEKITESNQVNLFRLIENVRKVFSIPNAEYYISKGDRNKNIIGYEGTPPFLIFGHDHIDDNSKQKLNYKELEFAVAVEFAHIYYKHSKITSQDVWRGVTEKGYFVIDTLLSAIPAAGLIAKSVQNVPRLSKLALILRTTDKVLKGSRNIYDTSVKLADFYQDKFKTSSKEEKEHKLLAASQLMQFTADRAAICISGNLKAAVRTIFLTGKHHFEIFEEVRNTSLEKILLKTNSDGTFKHQELALRLANLFSFYVSDEYDTFRKKLIR